MKKLEIDVHEHRLVTYTANVPDHWTDEDVHKAIFEGQYHSWAADDDTEIDEPWVEAIRFSDVESDQERLC